MSAPAADVRSWPPELVQRWLHELGLSQYSEKFLENDINGEALVLLDEPAMIELGISSVGHRMTLLTHIYELKQQHQVPMDQDDWVPQNMTFIAPAKPEPVPAPMDHAAQLRQRDEHIEMLENYILRINSEMQYMRDSLGRLAMPSVSLPGALGGVPLAGGLIGAGHSAQQMNYPVAATREMASHSTSHSHYALPGTTGTPDIGAAPFAPRATPPLLGSRPVVASPVPTAFGNTESPGGASNIPGDHAPLQSFVNQDLSPIDDAVGQLLRSTGHIVTAAADNTLITSDMSCATLLVLSLRRHGVSEDYSVFVLFIAFSDTERSVSYDERPLLLFRRLRDAGQNPRFVVRHMREVRSPIDLAHSKLQQRHSERHVAKNEALRLRAVLVDTDVQSHDQRVFSVSHWLRQPSFSGSLGEEALRRAKVMGPGAQLPSVQSVTYAVAVYPYESDRDDEYDVATGDTFLVLSKSKGWCTVRRDSVADGRGDVFMPIVRPSTDPTLSQGRVPLAEIWTGWVPAGCLLELSRPLSECLHGASDLSPAASIALITPTQGPISPTARLRTELVNMPIPLSVIASQGSSGVILVDFDSTDSALRVHQGDRVCIFKRYHNWSYCVVEQSFMRGWVPSWCA